jgi:hypothetical protein
MNPCTLTINYLPIGGPEGVEGVVAAEDEAVERNPLPASKCTHSKPLTPGSEGITASPLKAPRALDGLSILYLRNSMKEKKYRQSENLSKKFSQKLEFL